MIVPESYFTWVSSDGTTTGDEISQSAIALRNRTSEQDKQASRFDLGISTEHVYAYESDYYGVPVGMYLNSVEPKQHRRQCGTAGGRRNHSHSRHTAGLRRGALYNQGADGAGR